MHNPRRPDADLALINSQFVKVGYAGSNFPEHGAPLVSSLYKLLSPYLIPIMILIAFVAPIALL